MSNYNKITALYSRLSVGDEDRDVITTSSKTARSLRLEFITKFLP